MSDPTALHLDPKEQAVRDLWDLWMDRLTQKITTTQFYEQESIPSLIARLTANEYEVMHQCLRAQCKRYLREKKD